MALPQDGQNANGLTKVTEIPKGKELIFIDPTTNEGGIITLEDLTTQILKNLTSQTFALDQGTKTLPAALNELNSKRYREKITGTTTLEEYRTGNGKLPGEYQINGAIISGISSTEKYWGVLILSAVYDIQIVIIAGGVMYIRDFTGDPNVWSKWAKYSYERLN